MWTTEFGQEPITSNLGHMLTLDFDDTSGENFFGFNMNELSIYREDTSQNGQNPHVGVYSYSQPMAMFDVIEFKVPVLIA